MAGVVPRGDPNGKEPSNWGFLGGVGGVSLSGPSFDLGSVPINQDKYWYYGRNERYVNVNWGDYHGRFPYWYDGYKSGNGSYTGGTAIDRGGGGDTINPPGGGSMNRPKMTRQVSVVPGGSTNAFGGICKRLGSATLVGTATDIIQNDHLYLRRLPGRTRPYKKWKESWRLFKPITLFIGDFFTTQSSLAGTPQMISTGTALSSIAGSPGTNYLTDYCSASKPAGLGSTVELTWKSGVYGDFCFNMLKCTTNNAGTGTYLADMGLLDFFGNNISGSSVAYGLNYAPQTDTGIQTAYNAFGVVNVNNGPSPYSSTQSEVFFKYDNEIRIHNPCNFPIQVEYYIILPKSEAVNETPCFTYWNAEYTGPESSTNSSKVGANAVFNGVSLESTPVQSTAFNSLWRIHDKRVVIIGPGQDMCFHLSLPWSHVKSVVCEQSNLQQLKGCSHYVWWRFSSPDIKNGVAGVVENAGGRVKITGYSKSQVLPVNRVVPQVLNYTTTKIRDFAPAELSVENPDTGDIATGNANA